MSPSLSDPIFYGISAAARRCGVAERTLRAYERAGIITPQRDSANRRLFSESDIAKVRAHRASKVRRGSSSD